MLARTLCTEKLSMHQNCCNSCKNILHIQKNSPWQMMSTQRLKSPATLNTSIISSSFPQKTFHACLSPKQHVRLFRVQGNIVQHTPPERTRVVPKTGQTSSFMSQILQSIRFAILLAPPPERMSNQCLLLLLQRERERERGGERTTWNS